MEKNYGYCDLNIPMKCDPSTTLKNVLRRAVQLGYQTIAINRQINIGDVLPASRGKKKSVSDKPASDSTDFPPPQAITWDEKDSMYSKIKGREIHILHRLTVEIGDTSHVHKLIQSENAKKYDILAVMPTTDAAVQQFCQSIPVEIITFDPENEDVVRISRKMYKMATERGIYLEIPYAPMFRGNKLRRFIIAKAMVYKETGKSKNIIVSSGATSPLDLRSPFDVINLSYLFHLSEQQSKGVIHKTCRSLILHSIGRRCGKCVATVSKSSDLPESEQWAVPSELDTSDESECEMEDSECSDVVESDGEGYEGTDDGSELSGGSETEEPPAKKQAV